LYAQKWVQLGFGIPNTINSMSINTMVADDTGNVYVAGELLYYGSLVIAKWDGKSWSQIGGNFFGDGVIYTMVLDSVNNVYAGGTFEVNSSQLYSPCFIAKWDGSNFSRFDNYYNNEFNALIIDDSGSIYAAGGFEDINFNNYVTKWNGQTWTELGGTGMNGLNVRRSIQSIAVDKSKNVYAAGYFIDSNKMEYVAKYNGINWMELGTGSNALNANNYISSIVVDNYENVYAIGNFTNTDGNHYLAKWNGTSWSEVDFGKNNFYSNYNVSCLATDKSGNVYAAINPNTNPYTYPPQISDTSYVAKWNGSTWNVLGSDTSFLPFSVLAGLNIFYATDAITVDRLGNVYATLSNGIVLKWIADTTQSTIVTNTLAQQKQLHIYPNPSAGVLTIPNEYENIQMDMHNVLGQSVATRQLSKGMNTLDFTEYPSGMYSLSFTGQAGSYATIKWVKE